MKTYPLNTKGDLSAHITGLTQWLKTFKGKWVVTIENEKEAEDRVTNEAKRRHWAMMTQLAHHMTLKTGIKYTKEDAHEWAKETFLEVVSVRSLTSGETKPVYRSPTTKKEQYEWDEKANAHAATEWGFTFLGQEDWVKYRDAST